MSNSQSSDSFKYVNNDTPVTDPGGYSFSHALVATGWNESKQSFEIRNSWSNSWGNFGYCLIDKDYIANKFRKYSKKILLKR